jgi:hypothetical protein
VRQVPQRLVGLVEAIPRRGHLHADAGRSSQDLPSVVAGVGRHAAQHTLLEQVLLVVERWDVGQVDARHRQRAARVERGERRAHESPHGREQIAASSSSRGISAAPATLAAPNASATLRASAVRVRT